MNSYLDNTTYLAYFSTLVIAIGSSIAYGASNVVVDSTHAFLAFTLINFFNYLSVIFGYRILNGCNASASTRFVLAGLFLVAPLLLLDISASILIPDLSVSGFPVRTIAMSILGLIVLTTLCLSSSIESDKVNE